jgi:predicted glutamine amidotransferase
MCIICVKRIGENVPSEKIIKNMFEYNSDGAGFMWNDGKQVNISKGYMSLKSFKKALKRLYGKIDVKNTAIVYHCRITTSGGSKPENCHPFPVSEDMIDLKKTTFHTDLGVAHNGIIDISNYKNASDTMTYIVDELALLKKSGVDFLRNDAIKEMIKNRITSKLAFLEPDGTVTTIGDFIEDDGILYSNEHYKDCYVYTPYSTVWDYDDYVPTSTTKNSVATIPTIYDDYSCILDLCDITDCAIKLKSGVQPESLCRNEHYYADQFGGLYIYDEVYDEARPLYEMLKTVIKEDGKRWKFNKEESEKISVFYC